MDDQKHIDILVFEIAKEICSESTHFAIDKHKLCDVIQFLNINGTSSYFEEKNNHATSIILKRNTKEKITEKVKFWLRLESPHIRAHFKVCELPSGESDLMIVIDVIFGIDNILAETLYFNHDNSKVRDFLITFGMLDCFKTKINQAKKKCRNQEYSLISLVSNLV